MAAGGSSRNRWRGLRGCKHEDDRIKSIEGKGGHGAQVQDTQYVKDMVNTGSMCKRIEAGGGARG
jgi:hypothetical protein